MDFLVNFAFYVLICFCAEDRKKLMFKYGFIYRGFSSIELKLENTNIFDYLPIEEVDSDFHLARFKVEKYILADTKNCLSVHENTLTLANYSNLKCTPIKYISGNLYFKIGNDYYLPRYEDGAIKFKNTYREVAKFNIKQRVPNPRISQVIFDESAKSLTIKTKQDSSEFEEKDLIFEIDFDGGKLGFIEPSVTEKVITLNDEYRAQDGYKILSGTLKNGNYRSFTQTLVVNSPPLFCDGVSLRDQETGICVNCSKDEGIEWENKCYSCQPNQVLKDDACHHCNKGAIANRLKNLCVCTNENEVSLGLEKDCFKCNYGTKANAEKNTCMCTENKVWSVVLNQCECEGNKVWSIVESQCVCEGNKVWSIVENQCECEGNKVWSIVESQCECEGNKVWSIVENQCVCKGNKVWNKSNKICVCEHGSEEFRNDCLVCLAGMVFNSSRGCVCPENKVWSDAEIKCVCKENYIFNEVKEKCIGLQKKTMNTQSMTYNILTVIGSSILVGVIIFFVYKKLFRKEKLKKDNEMSFKNVNYNDKKNIGIL